MAENENGDRRRNGEGIRLGLGTIITAIVLLVSAGIGYGTLIGSVNAHERKLTDMAPFVDKIPKIDQQVQEQEKRLERQGQFANELSRNDARIIEELAGIRASLAIMMQAQGLAGPNRRPVP